MTARLIECPNGHRVKPVRVVYGMPTEELMADADAGRVRLGGCDPAGEDERVGDCPVCGVAIARRAVPFGEGNEPHFRPVGERFTDRHTPCTACRELVEPFIDRGKPYVTDDGVIVEGAISFVCPRCGAEISERAIDMASRVASRPSGEGQNEESEGSI